MTGDGIAVQAANLSLQFGKKLALDRVSLTLKRGVSVALVGPDGVGKSTLLSLLTGARRLQDGSLSVLGGDMRSAAHRREVCPKIAYMPQGLGKNLYFSLSVEENLEFFGRLFGHDKAELKRRIEALTKSTGLFPFLDRSAGKLSGGMKQKLGLCCALIHDPELLVLDEPTTGVDPLARRQFWELIASIRQERPQMAVIVATAYMDEAQGFEEIIAMDDGYILDRAAPAELLKKTGTRDLDAAFIQLLPEEKRAGHQEFVIPPLAEDADNDIAIDAHDLTKRFGGFTAVDHVSFRIRRGEIFGFLGSNGCGKTTTMRMLTGLLPATEGNARLFGSSLQESGMAIRRHLGYMTQSFSLYSELTVQQNLELSARLYHLPESEVASHVAEMLHRFHLESSADQLPESLPLGIRQRLSLAAAVIHHPAILILDEPTSGVDPVARDGFWELIIELSRRDRVTIFITTHFMNEAERCDRVSLMHAGRSLACAPPAELAKAKHSANLEGAFIRYLEEAELAKNGEALKKPESILSSPEQEETQSAPAASGWFSIRRFFGCFWRETLELFRDPIRLTLAIFGSMLLMMVMGYGVNMDVEDMTFAVLDRDGSIESRSYALAVDGSRYFKRRPNVKNYDDMDRRMASGKLSMVIEIPPHFGSDLQGGKSPEVGIWLDGAMPMRGRTMQGYVEGIHRKFLSERQSRSSAQTSLSPARIELRYRYNPDVRSLPAMVPAVIPILLLMIPAILSALSVVREKEMGSIINLYVTPLTRTEFLLGKQLPYILVSMLSAVLLVLETLWLFRVPARGSYISLFTAMLIYCIVSTGMGLLFSSLTKSQIAVIFMTMVGTILPSVQYCGMLNPVSALDGVGRLIGSVYPTAPMLIICRGVFNKALSFADLVPQFLSLITAALVIVALGIALQQKQAK